MSVTDSGANDCGHPAIRRDDAVSAVCPSRNLEVGNSGRSLRARKVQGSIHRAKSANRNVTPAHRLQSLTHKPAGLAMRRRYLVTASFRGQKAHQFLIDQSWITVSHKALASLQSARPLGCIGLQKTMTNGARNRSRRSNFAPRRLPTAASADAKSPEVASLKRQMRRGSPRRRADFDTRTVAATRVFSRGKAVHA